MKLELLTWLNASRSRQRSSIGRRNRAVRLSRLMLRDSGNGRDANWWTATCSRRRLQACRLGFTARRLGVQSQRARQEAAGVRGGQARFLFERALPEDGASAVSALGP